MQILVDKMPETPKECWFVKFNIERGYICPLQKCSCSIEYGLGKCPCLKEQKEADNG